MLYTIELYAINYITFFHGEKNTPSRCHMLKVCHIYFTDKDNCTKVDIYLAHSSPCCVCAFSQIIHILHHECLSVSTLKASSTLSVKSDLIPLVHSMISEDLKGTGHFHNQHPTICPSLCVCVCGLQFILLKKQNPLILIFLRNAIRSIDFYQMDLP